MTLQISGLSTLFSASLQALLYPRDMHEVQIKSPAATGFL